MAGRKIVIEFLGKDTSASKTAAGVGKNTGRLGAGFAKLNKLATGALLASGATAFKIGESFTEMRNTIIVGTGASGEALAGLEQVAKNVGKVTPASFDDIGIAVADLNTRLGLTGKPLEDMSQRFLNLSRITETDLSGNIANATRVFGDWSITAKDQPAALDAIFEATKRTGIGLDQLTNNVVQFGAPLRQFGYSFEESLALFGKWEKEGVNTEVILAGMKAGLGKLSKAGKEPAKALEDIQVAIKGAGSAGEANRIAIETFGQRAGPDMAAAVREGRFELGDMAEQLKKSGGAIADADKRTRTFKDSLQLLKNRVMIPLEPVAVKLFNAIGKGAEGAAKFVDKHGKVVGVAAAAIVGLAAAVVTINLGMKAWRATVAAWTAVTKAAAAAQWLLNAAMTANPIGLIVLALVGLGAALVIAYRKSETFRTIVDAAFKAIQKAASVAFGWIKTNWPLLLAIITGPIGLAVAAVSKSWTKIKTGARLAVNYIRTKFNNFVDFATGIPGKLDDAFSGAFNGLKSAFRSAINFVIDGWNGLSFSLPAFDPPGPGPKFGGMTISTPNIQRLYTGGIVKGSTGGTPIIAGDRGHDEAIVPLSGPHAPKFASGGGGNERPVQVNFYLDGKMIQQSLLKRGRETGQSLGFV